MKKITIIALASISQLFFTGCEGDLNTTPPDFMSEIEFYSNPSNFETGLNGVYDAVQSSDFYGSMISMLDSVSDNAVCEWATKSDFVDFAKGSTYASVSNSIEDCYAGPYVIIQRANTLLYYMESVGQGSLTDSDYTNMIAQARALRAIAYQRLVYLFGDVPFYTSLISSEEVLNISRTDRDEIIDFIVCELEDAAEDLNTTPMGSILGRMTKQAALAFAAQTMVYEARLGKQTWADALTTVRNAKSVAEGAGAELFKVSSTSTGVENYSGLFAENNTGNSEILFTVCYDYSLDSGPNYKENFSVEPGSLWLCVHENLVKDYYTTAGVPITDFDASNSDNWDPRLISTIVLPGTTYTDGSSYKTFSTQVKMWTDYGVRKYTTMNNNLTNDDHELNQGGLDMPVFRYAELLLLFAEAENQVNGATSDAYAAINAVRERVGVADVEAGLSKSEFNDEVIHERRIELALEGKRWFDLITLDIASEKINAITENSRKFIDGTCELFPIPDTEIARNSNLTQNPGY